MNLVPCFVRSFDCIDPIMLVRFDDDDIVRETMSAAKWLRKASTVATVIASHPINPRKRKVERSPTTHRRGGAHRNRIRRSVTDILNCLGPMIFRRAYRMSYESFLTLHEEMKAGIQKAHNKHHTRMREKSRKKKVANMTEKEKRHYYDVLGERNFKLPPVRNGPIDTSVRLACALRYFAGGSPYDIACSYGIAYCEVHNSVWFVVEAVNSHPPFFIEYPADVEKQLKIAQQFKNVSGIPFENCAGAIDGILIWIEKPTEKEAKKAGIGRKKFLCTRKNKFGLNCQAVADKRGRFLDISIKYGGSSSDCLAFEASDLCRRLENGLLCPGLTLFGDNAYINTAYMATPFPNVSAGGKDDYNFYHSQVSYCCCCFCL